MRLLLVEDTADLAEAIAERLTQAGHAVDWLTDGEQALKMLSYQSYSLIILDLGLPKLDGMRVLKYLRSENNKTPVLVLTARSGIDDRVQALDGGADDYLIKPIDLRELLARCRALLRRNHGEASNIAYYGQLQFDRSTSQITIGNEVLELPRRELCLLDLLLNHQGRALSKSQLADQLCSFADHDELPSENAIELYIGRLRKKLTGSGVTIKTLRGIGYLLHVES